MTENNYATLWAVVFSGRGQVNYRILIPEDIGASEYGKKLREDMPGWVQVDSDGDHFIRGSKISDLHLGS
jgi:hypothetical protein